MPTIYINLGYFLELGNMPMPLMMLRIMLDGGWIPMLIVLIWGSWKLFLHSRQMKYAGTLKFVLLAIDVPRINEQTPKAVESIFSAMSGAFLFSDNYEKYWEGKFQPTFSFEIVSIGGYVQFLVHCQIKTRDLVEAAIYSQYPDAEIVEVEDYAAKAPSVWPDPDVEATGIEYILKKPSPLPIRTYVEFEHQPSEEYFKDPMSQMLEVFSNLRPGEQLWFQIMVTPTDESWKDKSKEMADKMLGKVPVAKKSFIDDVTDIPIMAAQELASVFVPSGETPPPKKPADATPKMLHLSPGERIVLEGIQNKAMKIGFNCKIRMVYVARRDVYAKGKILTGLGGALAQFNTLHMNGIRGYGKVLPKSTYFYQRPWTAKQVSAIVRNYKNRSGRGAPPFILNTEELATIWHFPYTQVKAPLVKKTEAKRAEPPLSLPTLDSEVSGPFKKVKAPPPPPPPSKEEIDEDEEFIRNLPR